MPRSYRARHGCSQRLGVGGSATAPKVSLGTLLLQFRELVRVRSVVLLEEDDGRLVEVTGRWVAIQFGDGAILPPTSGTKRSLIRWVAALRFGRTLRLSRSTIRFWQSNKVDAA